VTLIGALLAPVLAADVVESWDLESDDGSLVPAGEIALWEWGDVTSGPDGGFTGSRAWGTNLDGTYGNDSVETLTLPVRDLVAVQDPALCWMQWLDLEQGDAGWITWTDGVESVVVEPIYGYPVSGVFDGFTGAWEPVCVDLAGVGDLGQLQLVFSADAKVSATGWYVDDLSLYDGDPIGPLLTDLTALSDTDDLDGPYPVSVTAVDNVSLQLVRLGHRVDGVDQPALPMGASATPDEWTGTLPGQEPGSLVEYWVDATDGQNWTRIPEDADRVFTISLATPTDLTGPEGRVVATTAELSWQAPDSSHLLSTYRVYRQDAVVSETPAPTGLVDLVGEGGDVFTVTAVYDVGESGPSASLTLDSHVPQVLAIEPDRAFQGDSIRVSIEGQDLFFVQEDLSMDLGDGVTIDEVEVADVDTARLLVSVGENAGPRLRDVVLSSGDVTLTLPDAFEVVDGAERPHLKSVEPDFVTQGSEAELMVVASADFAALPTVDLGEGVVVSEVAWTDDDELRLTVVVELDAPLGEHELTIDDTVRIWDGLRVQVRDDPPATTSCAGVPGSRSLPLGVWVLMLGLVLRRHRADHSG